VEEREEHKGGRGAGDAAGGVGGLFDVQMILEMRRRVLEGEDDDSDAESVDDDDWENN